MGGAQASRWTRPTGLSEGSGSKQSGPVEAPAPLGPASSEDLEQAAAEQEAEARKAARAAKKAGAVDSAKGTAGKE